MAKKKKDETTLNQKPRMTDIKQAAQQNRQNARLGSTARYSTGDQKKATRQRAADIATGSVTKPSTKTNNYSTSTKKSSYGSSATSQRASNNTRTSYTPQRGGHIPTTVQNSYGVQRRGTTTTSGRTSGRGQKQNVLERTGKTLKGSVKQFAGGHLSSIGSNLQTQEVTARSIHNAKADNRNDSYKLRSRADAEKREQNFQNTINKKEGVDTVKALEWRDRNARNPLKSIKDSATETAKAYNNARTERGEQSYSLRSREEAEKTRDSMMANIGRKEGVDIRNVERPKKAERPNEFPEFDEYSPSQKLIRTGDELIESGSKDIERAKAGAGAVGRFLIDAGANATQMALDRSVGAIGDLIVPGMGTALSMGSLMNRAGGTASYEARQKGSDPDQQFRYGLGVSLVEGLSEGVFNSVSAFRSTYGAGAFDLADRVSKRVAASNIVRNYFNSPAGRSFIINASRLGAQGLEEGSEEVIADIIEPLLEKAITGSSDGIELKQMIYDFMVGAFMGAVPGTVDVARNVRTDSAIQNAMSEGRLNEDEYINRGLIQGRTGKNATNAELLAKELQEQKAQGKEVLPSQMRMLMEANAEAESSNTYEFRKRKADEYNEAVKSGKVGTVERHYSTEEQEAIGRVRYQKEAELQKEAKDIMGEESSETSQKAVARVMSGSAETDDIDTILLDNDARKAVEDIGKVVLPEDHAEAREVLENLAVNNQIANEDTTVSQAHEEIRNSMSQRNGDFFDEHYNEAIEALDVPNGAEIYDSVFSRLYTDGTVEGSDFNESYDRIVTDLVGRVDSEIGERISNYFDKAFAEQIFNRGRDAMSQENLKAAAKSQSFKYSAEYKPGKISHDGNARKMISDTQYNLLEKFAQRANVHIRIMEKILDEEGHEANGMYKEGVIYISANSDNKFIVVAKHELTHHLKATAFDAYKELEDFVFRKQYESNAEALENRIRWYQKNFGYTPEEAREEIIADASEAFFTDDGAIQDALSFSKKLGKAISDGIHTLLDTFISLQDTETDFSRRQTNAGDFLKTLDILKDAEQMWLKALDESANRDKSADSTLGRNDSVPTREQIESGNATYGGIPIKYDSRLTSDARNYTSEVHVSDKFFNHAEDEQRSILNHEVAHNLSDELMDSHTEDWSDFASKFITEKKYSPNSDAYRSGKRTYQEGLYGDMGATALSETVTHAITEYLDDPARLKSRSKEAYEEIDSFMRGGETEAKKSLKARDESYMDAVNRGDIETAQKMVDEEAKRHGYTVEGYHGTQTFGFTKPNAKKGKFSQTFFVTDSIDQAVTYSDSFNRDTNEATTTEIKNAKDSGGKGNYHLFVNTEGLLEVDAKNNRFHSVPFDMGNYTDKWGVTGGKGKYDTDEIARYALVNGYKGVWFKNLIDNGGLSKRRYGKPANVYALFNPESQTKSADPVTYDDNGNVIPLSQRFNENNDDIRYSRKDSEGNELSKGQQEYFGNSQVKNEDGSLKVMYHGSPNKFTTFDIKKAKPGLYGRGFYFTEDKSRASQYGEPYKVYLDIETPLQTGTHEITKPQLRKFISVLARDEDYGIENYGYGATVDSVLKSVWGKDDYSMLQDLNASAVGDFAEAVQLFNKVNGTYYDGIIAPTETIAFYPEQIKETVNKNPTKDPDIRFSKKEAVEETKDLLAVHNLTSDNLEGALKLGGFPMPSIAIIKADAGHNMYGEFSAIFDKSTIDPSVTKRNVIYGGDAWTPTFPRIQYKPSDKVARKLSNLYYEYAQKIGYDAMRPLYKLANDTEDGLNDAGGEKQLIESTKESVPMMRMFLKMNDKDVQNTVKRTETTLSDGDINLREHFIKAFGRDGIEEFAHKDASRFERLNLKKEWVKEHKDKINEVYSEWLKDKDFTDEQVKMVLDDMKLMDYMSLIQQTQNYIENGATTVKEEIDYDATNKAVEERAKAEGYDKWVDDLLTGIEEKQGIRNNTDFFTRSGNRRSWEALHDEPTLVNIVNVMAAQDNGETLFGSSLKAVGQKKYKNISEVRADKGRLKTISEEEYKKLMDSFAERETEIIYRIDDASPQKYSDNPFTRHDNIRSTIVDNVRKGMSKSAFLNDLKKWAYTKGATAKDVDDIFDLVHDVANIPTGYFEAKPKRPVTFEEVKAIVAPSDASPELISKLQDEGVSVVQYEAGNEEDRVAKLNQAAEETGTKFSRKEDPEYMEAVKSGDMTKVQQIVNEAAKESGYGTRLYHGTRDFGFTQIRTHDLESKSDGGYYDWSPFFATDSLEVARTYSAQDEVKRVNEGAEPFDEERFDDDYNDAVNDLVSKINSFAGYYNYMDYDKNIFTNAFGELQNSSRSASDIAEELIEDVDNIIMDIAWEKANEEAESDENVDVDVRADELQGGMEADDVYLKLDMVNSLLQEYDQAMYGDTYSGNYELFANTDNILQVDAKGHRWNDIPFDSIPEKRGYYRTRDLAEIARDEGYDGVQISNVFDDGGKGKGKKQTTPASVYIFFKPERQIKSADPVVYDNKGEVIPLSERFNPENEDIRYSRKEDQYDILQNANPMLDTYHTGIRSAKDIKNASEVFARKDFSGTPDWTYEDAQKALKNGKITVFSSKPIVNGAFVTPSMMEAESYAGEGNFYQAEVPIEDVAWIDSVEGQYAKVSNEAIQSEPKFSIKLMNHAAAKPVMDEGGKVVGARVFRDKNGDPLLMSGLEVTSETMRLMGKESKIPFVKRFLEKQARFMEKMGEKYTFIGLKDVSNADLEVRRDKNGKPVSIVVSAMVKNGEYPVNFDFSSICKKRQALSKLFEKLSTGENGEFLDSVELSVENLWRINEILSENGFETACLGCFVETKRYGIENWADTFAEKWNKAVLEKNPNAEYFNFASSKDIDFGYVSDEMDRFAENKKDEREKESKRRKRERASFIKKWLKNNPGESEANAEKAYKQWWKKAYNLKADQYKESWFENPALSNEKAIISLVNSGDKMQKLIRKTDLISPKGLKALMALHPDFYGVLYGHFGSGTPKPMVSFTPYNSEIALLGRQVNPNGGMKRYTPEANATLVNKLVEIGGVRIQSFSDFLIQNTFDYMQMVADMAARNFPAHAYTKEIAFAKIFGLTGIKINLSVMFDVDPEGIAPGLDKDGNYVVADKSRQEREKKNGNHVFAFSISYDEAVELQNSEGYDGNVGIIGVGLSDLHIRKMLNDPDIKMVIPYHSSGMPAVIKQLTKLGADSDYTSTQNTLDISKIERDGVDVTKQYGKDYMLNLYKEKGSWKEAFAQFRKDTEGCTITPVKAFASTGNFPLYTGDPVMSLDVTNDPKLTAEYYMGWCVENGHFPLFYQFADEENYYKVLYDFNVYHNDGTYAPQNAVENEYPEDLESVIEQYMKEANDFEQAQMPKWDNVINETKEMLKSNSYKEENGKYSRKSNDDILDRYMADRQKRIDDGEQMSFFGSLNETLPSKPKTKTRAEKFYDNVLKTIANIQKKGSWSGMEVKGLFLQYPEFNFIERLNNKSDDTAEADFKAFISSFDKTDDLRLYNHYFSAYEWNSEWKKRNRSGKMKFNKLIENRIEEIMAGKAHGRNVGIEKRDYTPKEMRKLFNELNTDKELKELGKKVFDCIDKNFDVKFQGVANIEGFKHGQGGTLGQAGGRTVHLNMKYLNSEGYTDQQKASTILHESIHTVTVYALRNRNDYTMPKNIQDACDVIEDVFWQIKNDPSFKDEYGVSKGAEEMVAELANPIFRAKLKAKNVFARVIEAIRNILGINVEVGGKANAFKEVNSALETLMSNADVVSFERYASRVSRDYNGKFSRKESTSSETLSTQNTIAKLEEQVADLKAEFKRTNLKTANQKDVRVQAGRLIQRHGSNMQAQTSLMDTFNKIFGLYKDKGEKAFDEVYEIAKDEAVNIVNNIGVIHNEGAEEYKAIKQYLRETPIRIDEAMKRNITDYNDFRKRNFGRLKLVNGETSNIDNVYMELSELFPAQFTEDYVNPHDQLNHIIDVLDNYAPFYESLDGASEEMQDYVVDIAADIMETAYNLQTKKTFADKKYEEKVKAVAKAREEALASRNRALDRQKQRYEKKLDTLKEKRQDFKADTRENAEKKRRIKQISNVYKRLLEKLQTPSDTKHLPDGYAPVVSNVLKMFDFTTPGMEKWAERHGEPSKRYKYMIELRKQLEQMSKDEGSELEVDPDLLDLVDEIIADMGENQRLIDMDPKTLEDIAVLFRAFEHQVNSYNKAFDEANKKTVSDTAHSIFDHLDETKKSKWHLGIMGRLLTSNFNPSDFFELVGGDIANLYNATRLGFDKYVDRLDNAKTFLQDMVDNKKADKWANHLNTFKTSAGEEIQLTDTQLMSLYCLNKREQAQGHIYVGGIVSAPLKVRSKNKITTKELEKTRVIPTIDDIGRWFDTLTDEQKRVADSIQRYFVDEVSDWGNETSMKLYNYKKFGEENYFPIQSSSDYMASNFDQRGDDPVLKNMGMTKALTKNASNAIVVDDIFTVYSKHVAQMASYNAYVPAITDFQRVWNYTEGNDQDMVKARFERVYGKKAAGYIDNFFKNLNGVYKANFDPTILDKGLGLFKKAAVGGNIRVLVQQPTAIARSALIVNPAYLTAAIPLATAQPKKTYKEMMDHCPIARWKTWGFYSSDITSASRDLRNIMIGKDALTDKIFMNMYGTADNVTWTVIFKACELQVEAQNKGLKKGSDEYWTKVNELASRVFDRTQVVDSPFHRSEIMKSQNGITKMATAFMAEPTKTINMINTELTKAATELKNGHPARATGIFVRVGMVITANAAALAMAQALVDAMRHAGGDDDKDKGDYEFRFKNYWKSNFADNLNPLGMIPYVKDIKSQWEGYDVLRMDMNGVQKVVQSIQYLQKYYEDPSASKYSAQEEWTNLALSTMYAIGVPVSNAKRDIEGLYVSIMEGTGHPEVFFHQAQRKYQVNDKTKGSFVDMYYDALKGGNKSLANEIHRYLIKNGITEDYIERRKKTWEKHQSSDDE